MRVFILFYDGQEKRFENVPDFNKFCPPYRIPNCIFIFALLEFFFLFFSLYSIFSLSLSTTDTPKPAKYSSFHFPGWVGNRCCFIGFSVRWSKLIYLALEECFRDGGKWDKKGEKNSWIQNSLLSNILFILYCY